MNTVCLSGRSVQDLELKTTKNGKNYVKFRIAVDRPFTSDTQDFFTLCIWGSTAEFLCRNVTKGTVVTASGYLVVNEWEGQNGEKRRDIEINCSECNVVFSTKTKQKDDAPKNASQLPLSVTKEIPDEDLPFEL